MILIFLNSVHVSPVMILFPVLPNKIYLTRGEIRKWAEAAKQILAEEQDPKVSQTSLPHFTTEGLNLGSLETPILKHHVKQDPVKSSKKLKYKPKEDDE